MPKIIEGITLVADEGRRAKRGKKAQERRKRLSAPDKPLEHLKREPFNTAMNNIIASHNNRLLVNNGQRDNQPKRGKSAEAVLKNPVHRARTFLAHELSCQPTDYGRYVVMAGEHEASTFINGYTSQWAADMACMTLYKEGTFGIAKTIDRGPHGFIFDTKFVARK